MPNTSIMNNEYLTIYEENNDIYIETHKKGFPFDQLNTIFSTHPEIGITSYTILRNAISAAPKPSVKFGELRERISVELSSDCMHATVAFNLKKEELDLTNREHLIKQLLPLLSTKQIIFGIKHQTISGELLPGKTYTIAEGTPPVHGMDSIITMYELMESKPEVQQNGSVDFYHLKLINRVKVGDWLGERIEATHGEPGKNVKGEPVAPVKGKNCPLLYDPTTVQEILEGKTTTLYSKTNGAVHYTNGKINISNHLEITGDVDLSTGNINFDGYLTVKGTVTDGFCVEATRDIEINGDLGLGNVKSIISSQGSIFIKGGIAARGNSEITASKNIYTKFVDNAVLKSGGITHIGYYCVNSHIRAKEVVIDSSSGKIIGGEIVTDFRVTAPIVGSEIEKKTTLHVLGFDRKQLVTDLDVLLRNMNDNKNEQQRVKQLMVTLESMEEMNRFQQKQYTDYLEQLFTIKEKLKSLEDERKNLLEYLKVKGEGEISITKKAYPNCTLTIKNHTIEITRASLATTYFLFEGQIKEK